MKAEDYDLVLKTVSAWPVEQRASLLNALINSLGSAGQGQKGPKPTIDELVGVARGEGPPPTDEQVKQWIDEHRMQKYGR